jgi:hypothetical protein
MAAMIDMPPPPEPPPLPAEKVRGLIEYADRMVAFMQAETELIGELGRAAPENDLSPLIEGWKFVAQAMRDGYDGQY